MATPEVPVNAATLVWARRRANATIEQAAQKAAVEESRLRAWEDGTEQPTVAQLRRLADLYKRPLAFFLLDQVPHDFTVMKSFRRLPDSEEPALSYELTLQLRQALQRREIAIELSEQIGHLPRPFRPKASLSKVASAAAGECRAALAVSLTEQQRWRDDYQAFRAWRAAVEEHGVLVLQAPGVTLDEMRGVSIFQRTYPIILLNSADAVRGRIFTLIHEVGHLLLRDEVSQDSDDVMSDPREEAEVWCNEFAGSLLVPRASLAWPSDEWEPHRFDWELLRSEANRFKVSREVILRRLLSLGRLTKKEYQALRKELHRRSPQRAAEGGPVAQDIKVLSRLGVGFVRTVVAAYRQEKITLSDVADYLDVRVKYLSAIEERVLRADHDTGADA